MNLITLQFEIADAHERLERVLAEIRDGRMKEDDDAALAVHLKQVLDYLCRAWNCRNLTQEELGNLTQEEFNRLSNTVPNRFGERMLELPPNAETWLLRKRLQAGD